MKLERLKELAGMVQLTESEAPSKVSKPQEGKSYGTSDGGAPEGYTAAQLSRLADALYAAQQAGISPAKVWALAPEKMRMEWNYAKWSYVS